jgi:hypothetical protein
MSKGCVGGGIYVTGGWAPLQFSVGLNGHGVVEDCNILHKYIGQLKFFSYTDASHVQCFQGVA